MIWIAHFATSDLFDILDELAKFVDEMPSPLCINVLNGLPVLLSLRGILQDYAALDDLRIRIQCIEMQTQAFISRV